MRERREIYGALNAAARNYRSTVKSLLFENPPVPDQVQGVRREFDRKLAEAQLIATDQVLASAHRAMRKLNDTFGIVMEFTRSANSDAEPGARSALIAELDGPVFEAIQAMRMAMREDLGTAKSQT